MISVGIQELKARASELIRSVSEQGETIEVTKYGHVVARIVPAYSPAVDTRQLIAELDELDRIAADIGAEWPEHVRAIDAIREDRS